MSYVVTLIYLGNKFYLRSTIWTSERLRATEFPTMDAANVQLNKAKQFMKVKQFRAAKIEAATN